MAQGRARRGQAGLAALAILGVCAQVSGGCTGDPDRSPQTSRVVQRSFSSAPRPTPWLTSLATNIAHQSISDMRAVATGRNDEGDEAVLWLALTRSNRFCILLQARAQTLHRRSVGATCGSGSSSPALVPLLTAPGTISRDGVPRRSTVLIGGVTTNPRAASVSVEFADGELAHPTLVVLSEVPFQASVFVFVVPRSRLAQARRPTELALRDREGRAITEGRLAWPRVAGTG